MQGWLHARLLMQPAMPFAQSSHCSNRRSELQCPAWQHQLLQACRNAGVMREVELCCDAPFSSACRCLQGALVMPLMSRGFKKGVVKFSLITAQKPLE